MSFATAERLSEHCGLSPEGFFIAVGALDVFPLVFAQFERLDGRERYAHHHEHGQKKQFAREKQQKQSHVAVHLFPVCCFVQ